MEQILSVKEAFDRLAKNGCLGDPDGELAYCYIRVSSAQQAEDGRTGLPRQIEHCHQVASEHHLKISKEMLFADDGFSGFEFENRPAFSQLREEIKKQPRSRFVVIEHLDRLSRNARWHQGYLLDEFAKYRIATVFWKPFSSEIERAVLGTIAEEGMRSEISRMMEGMILKAKSGRVTAKRPRFGFMFVDGEGKVSEKSRKDTHYALHPEESKIARWIYESIIREHKSLRMIAADMNDKKIPTRFNGKIWCSGTIARIVSDPIYKGEFYAHRFYVVKTGRFNPNGRPRQVTRERPKEEWIQIAVPAIVTSSEWQLAQDILAANQKRSTRNMKRRDWLLSAFCKCAICGYGYIAVIGGSPNHPIRYYACNGHNQERGRVLKTACHSPYVRADELETFVWSKIEELLLNPDLVMRLLDEDNSAEQEREEEQHLQYIESQLDENLRRYERWQKAYESEVISLDEFQGYRNEFHKQKTDLEEAQRAIESKVDKRLSREDQKRQILAGLAELREGLPQGENIGIPFEMKRRLLQQLLDCIWIDSHEKTIRFEGALKSSYRVEDTEFVFGSNRKSR
jgi:site-specific DNA recombinase